MDEYLLPFSIRDERLTAAEDTIKRLHSLDLSALDLYNIDTVPSEILYDLADHFNVLGNRGWLLAKNDEQRRNLIRRSAELHKTAGTPFSVKQALDTVGYPNVQIIENPGLRYDGSETYDGRSRYEGAQLGQFIVILDPARSAVSIDLRDQIVALINEWKNARSVLADLRIGDISLFGNLLTYNGRISYSGANDQIYSGELRI